MRTIKTLAIEENIAATFGTWNRYETGIKDGMVIYTDTHMEDGEDRKTGTYFMFYC